MPRTPPAPWSRKASCGRRRSAAPRHQGAAGADRKVGNTDQKTGIEIVRRAGSISPGAPDHRQCRRRRRGGDRQAVEVRTINRSTASTRRPANMPTCSRRASSTRPRSCAPRFRTLPRSLASWIDDGSYGRRGSPKKDVAPACRAAGAWATWNSEPSVLACYTTSC